MTVLIDDDGIDNNKTDDYISDFSVMALADLGYVVSYQKYPL